MSEDEKIDTSSIGTDAAAKAPKSKAKASKAKTSKAKVSQAKGSAATAKAAASGESDMASAAKKISEMDKQAADDVVRSKSSSDNLKARAHEAKQRAQKKILEEAYVSDKPTDPLERLANTFDNSARRWEMVVYPSLFAFVLLAGYGFFLIYRLTHDISTLSQSVTRMAVIVSDAMPRMTKDLNLMTGNIGGMTTEISSMSTQMNSLTPMSKNIQSMTHNIGSMNNSVYGMQRDMHGMNRTVSSGPFGMMNDVMPFSSGTNVPPPITQRPVWPSYNPAPQRVQVRRPNTQVRSPDTKSVVKAPSKSAPIKKVAPVTVSQEKLATQIQVPGASPVSLKK
jgi:hypothetical protein